jgi:hypothetical protein
VVLVRLNDVEVGSEAFLETVVTVELKLGANSGVASSVKRSKTSMVGTSASTVVTSHVHGSRAESGRITKSIGEVDTRGKKSFDFSGGLGISLDVGEGASHVSGFNVGTKNTSAEVR